MLELAGKVTMGVVLAGVAILMLVALAAPH